MLKFDIQSNGLLSAIPPITVVLVCLLTSFISDKIIKGNLITKKNVRRIFNAIGTY